MVGVTLVEIRDHIETLATDDGEYSVVCGRTGDRPVPVAGKRFDRRATARSAARATEQYRTALRRYDPRLPYYDLIVCQGPASGATTQRRATPSATAEPTGGDTAASTRHGLVERCHRVAGAVFETLSEAGHDAVETAVMDAYFELAERVGDPDELCLCLLESMAIELDDRLDVADQADVLADAATRVGPADATAAPLAAALASLEDWGLVDGYTRSPWSVDTGEGTRSVVVHLSEYRLSPHDGRLPVFPVVLELYRRSPKRGPTSLRVADDGAGWRVTVVLSETVGSTGLATAPIEAGG